MSFPLSFELGVLRITKLIQVKVHTRFKVEQEVEYVLIRKSKKKRTREI